MLEISRIRFRAMPKKYNNPVNIASLTHKGGLGKLFEQAKKYNQINDFLYSQLPRIFNSVQLCTIEESTATFIAADQSSAYRARQQKALLLKSLHTIDGLSYVKKINIKVNSI